MSGGSPNAQFQLMGSIFVMMDEPDQYEAEIIPSQTLLGALLALLGSITLNLLGINLNTIVANVRESLVSRRLIS